MPGVGPNADVRDWHNETTEENRGRIFGSCIGVVMDRDDPLKRGRVRVYCAELMPSDNPGPDQWLDWSDPMYPGLMVPPLGATVAVTFGNGFIADSRYVWARLLDTDVVPLAGTGKDPNLLKELIVSTGTRPKGVTISATLPADTPGTYPDVYAFDSPHGHTIELDDTPGNLRARYRHPSGTTILVMKDGSVRLDSVGGVYHHCAGDYVIALDKGSTFKVVYPGGTGLALGAQGFFITGFATNMLGRVTQLSPDGM